MSTPGQIVILNGAPRSGKSSIVKAMQENLEDVWINLGVDVSIEGMTPEKFRPGIGLRSGGERPDLEALVVRLYLALYDSIAAHSRHGLNVVAEFGHHDFYSEPLFILQDCARRLEGLPVLFVGVRCPVEEIMRRRNSGSGSYVVGSAHDPVPEPVRRWQDEVHRPGIYDLEVDTSTTSPEACAELIRQRLSEGNTGAALLRLIGGR
jgi:chloramphenicol 3-O phosphotransferase